MLRAGLLFVTGRGVYVVPGFSRARQSEPSVPMQPFRTDVTIEPATADDAPAILRLLSGASLPADGVVDHLTTAIVARADGAVVGCAALEVYPDGALLRSVAVGAAARGQGIGTLVTTAALNLASSLGVSSVFLLTITAETFFQQFAFERTTRQNVPAGVRSSVEFHSACPSTATVMRRTLATSSD